MMNILPPQQLHGDEMQQIGQVYRYLFSLSEDLNFALSGLETGTGADQILGSEQFTQQVEESVAPSLDAQAQSLKALIVKTANIVRSEMDVLITQLDKKYEAISDWGTYKEQITKLVQETAQSTLESYDFVSQIQSLQSDAAGFDSYMTQAKGYINRGIIDFDDENMPIFGIAIGETLKTKQVSAGGKSYEVFDTTENMATYTADRLSFWVGGVEVAYLSNRVLSITKAEITESIRLGDWEIAVNAKDGMSVQRRIGDALDLAGNDTFTLKSEKVQAVVNELDLSANDSINVSANKVQAVIDDVDLKANKSYKVVTDKYEAVAGKVEQVQEDVSTNAVYVGKTAPDSPTVGKQWINQSVQPWLLQVWNGSTWEIVNDTEAIEDALGSAAIAAENAQKAADTLERSISRSMRMDSSGWHYGDVENQNEMVIATTDDNVLQHFVVHGERVATIGKEYHRFGSMEIRTIPGRGIVIQAAKEST